MAAAPFHNLPCSYLGNSQHAEAIFKVLCPATFNVLNVRSQRMSKKPFCRWEVTYVRDPRHQGSYAGGANARIAFDEVTRIQPNNANVCQRFRSEEPPSFVVTYGVRCMCQKDFKLLTTPHLGRYEYNNNELAQLQDVVILEAELLKVSFSFRTQHFDG